MKLSQILGKDKITLSFEVFPPKTEANYEAVKKAALDVAALNPSYMSVTYGAGGSTRANTDRIGNTAAVWDHCNFPSYLRRSNERRHRPYTGFYERSRNRKCTGTSGRPAKGF